jgi:hypothetical protein
MDILPEFTFGTKFNQLQHEVEIYLDNGSTDTKARRFPINPNSIVNLSIEDTMADWAVNGSMSFFYNPEASIGEYDDRTGNTSGAQTGLYNPDQKSFFHFRNDGNDLLRIRITPKSGDSSNLAAAGAGSSFNIQEDDKHWTLSYLFSIYDMEDIDLPPGAQNAASATIKCLKIYFWDSWYQKMITNTMQYSTALSYKANIEADIQEGIYYNPGTIYTGQAMKEIIDLSLSTDSSQTNYSGNTIIDTSLQFNYMPTAKDGEDWDQGAAKIFYTSPANATAYDSLMYIYDKHVSSYEYNAVNDFSILMKDRGPKATDVGILTLKSVASFFEKAGNSPDTPGEYQTEHYFLQSYASDKDRATKYLRGPISNNGSDKVDMKSLKYNQITNYRFVDMSALTNTTQFCTTPVYSFDFKNRQFNVEFKDNSVETARTFISKNYIDNVYKKNGNDNEKLFLISLDKDKKNKNIKPAFSLYGDNKQIRQSSGLQKLLYLGLFHNMAINFRTLGLTSREPGRFISIDKTDGVEDGIFEDKFFGQWFIINVKHVIESELYYNDITAVKVHRFNALPLGFSDTI